MPESKKYVYICHMIYRELSDREYSDAGSRILYEDNHLLIVNKKAGEIVQADITQDETLSDAGL